MCAVYFRRSLKIFDKITKLKKLLYSQNMRVNELITSKKF